VPSDGHHPTELGRNEQPRVPRPHAQHARGHHPRGSWQPLLAGLADALSQPYVPCRRSRCCLAHASLIPPPRRQRRCRLFGPDSGEPRQLDGAADAEPVLERAVVHDPAVTRQPAAIERVPRELQPVGLAAAAVFADSPADCQHRPARQQVRCMCLECGANSERGRSPWRSPMPMYHICQCCCCARRRVLVLQLHMPAADVVLVVWKLPLHALSYVALACPTSRWCSR